VLSYWPRIRKLFRDNLPLFIWNVLWAALNLLGYVIMAAGSSTGTLLVFFAASMSFLGAAITMMPNHHLLKPPAEMAQAMVMMRNFVSWPNICFPSFPLPSSLVRSHFSSFPPFCLFPFTSLHPYTPFSMSPFFLSLISLPHSFFLFLPRSLLYLPSF
jgi:hypothetical protein